ncbi:putative magnesium transporter NIPA [Helianthus annuus]|uniref:Probable magnesium transporter n=1 Tax=Helianthus annuus TaxID=4232 RepID=A0A251VA87_HELAN|nr:putative magnesium transporter NIPA [Helianthus annuus]KAJ0775137.1 putative magnesium transporter NIPA [Helianthus annuus]
MMMIVMLLLMMIDDGGDDGGCVAAVCGSGRRGQWRWFSSRRVLGSWVMSVKAIGIALKLTLSGMNKLVYPQTWAFSTIVLLCIITKMIFLIR